MANFDSYNAISQAASFGSNMQNIQKGFEARNAGKTMGQQQAASAGGKASAAIGGITEVAGAVMGAVDKFKGGKGSKHEGTQIAQRKQKASGALDIAASVADQLGPFGQIAGAAIKIANLFLKIKGPRQKRREKAAAERRVVEGRTASRRANLIASATNGGGGHIRTGEVVPSQPATVQDPTAGTPSFQGRGTTG